MLNVANKCVGRVIAIAVVACVMWGCGESKEEKAAKETLALANECFTQGDYDRAMALLDTIPVLYPGQVKVRQAALDLKPVVIEMATDSEIDSCEEDIARTQEEFGQAQTRMLRVDSDDLIEGYWVPASFDYKGFMNSTGIQPRVNDDGTFGIISEVNNAGKLYHNAIRLKSADGEVAESGAVPFDNELNYRIANSETVTYSEEKVDTIGRFAAKHYGEPMELTFVGENGKDKTIRLSSKETAGIADAYNMATLQKRGKKLVVYRMMLERKREIAREQQSRRKNVSQ